MAPPAAGRKFLRCPSVPAAPKSPSWPSVDGDIVHLLCQVAERKLCAQEAAMVCCLVSALCGETCSPSSPLVLGSRHLGIQLGDFWVTS